MAPQRVPDTGLASRRGCRGGARDTPGTSDTGTTAGGRGAASHRRQGTTGAHTGNPACRHHCSEVAQTGAAGSAPDAVISGYGLGRTRNRKYLRHFPDYPGYRDRPRPRARAATRCGCSSPQPRPQQSRLHRRRRIARPEMHGLVDAIAEYARAVESESIDNLKRVYPGMTPEQQKGWEQFFSTVRDVKSQLNVQRADISGDRARSW